MSIFRSTHEARVKTFCPVEGEVFWRHTRYIGQSPVVQENMIKTFPHTKDIESIIANQKKGKYAYLKLSLGRIPQAPRYIPALSGDESRVNVFDPTTDKLPVEPGVKTIVLSLVDQPQVHMEQRLINTNNTTPNYLFEKYSTKRVSAPVFSTLKEVDEYNKEVLERIEDTVSGRYRSPLLDSAFVGIPFARSTVEIRELNPRFSENPMVDQLATSHSAIGLSEIEKAHLKMAERVVGLRKKWRRYHQTSDRPGEQLFITNGYSDYYTDKLHFWDGDITLPNTISVPLDVEYEFYPYIDDEFDYLRKLQQSLEFIQLLGGPAPRNMNYSDKTTNAEVAAYIDHMISVGLSPLVEISAIDVLCQYISSRSPTILNPFDASRFLFAAQRLKADDKIERDGILIIRQNGVITDIIYIITTTQVFFHATRKSPSGRYAIKREELFVPDKDKVDLAPRCILNSWVGASEEHPKRVHSKFVLFTPTQVPGQKLFEDVDTIDENVTPLVIKSPPEILSNLSKMSPIASLTTLLRRECYANAIPFGIGSHSSTTEALYGTVMARGVYDIKVYLALEEFPK